MARASSFTATDKARTQLYVRALDQMNSVALPGTDGAANPFFSPDGNGSASPPMAS